MSLHFIKVYVFSRINIFPWLNIRLMKIDNNTCQVSSPFCSYYILTSLYSPYDYDKSNMAAFPVTIQDGVPVRQTGARVRIFILTT